MATKAKSTKAKRAQTSPKRVSAKRAKDIKDVGAGASKVVQKAASILEEELAAGIAGADQVEQRFREERQVNQDEFEDVMKRFREDAHLVVNMVSDRLDDLRSDETQKLIRRFVNDAHDGLDVVMNLVNMAPDLINRLAKDEASRADDA